ncbi:hypothetical protein AB0G02_34500 [Actinosynnema sp. NPDC023658]|uniref:hypothetical protein n=1 Tax=Actinosynnema sp. NPDC023658 TaxID=3155465 RepID=UPI00340F35A4
MKRWRVLAHVAGVITLTAGLLTAVFTGPASACSCQPGTEADRFQRATHVFSGLVLSETVEVGDPAVSYDDRYRYAVAVGTEYKGDVPQQVDVLTYSMASLCGFRLARGVEYVVFAFGDSSDGRVESTSCSGTRAASAGPPVTTTSTTTTPTTTCTTAP